MDIIYTYLLIAPYLTIIIYFYSYKRDSYFYRVRSSILLTLIMLLLSILFIQLMLWICFFEQDRFLGLSIKASTSASQSSITALVAIFAAIAAVIGWLFTSRVQIINATKTHAMQVLMNSRNSTAYVGKVDDAMELRKKLYDEAKEAGIPPEERIVLTKEKYLKLSNEERSAVHYLLNFLEFIAVGVRHTNLDEEMVKGSFQSILKNNYLLFQPVIEHVRVTVPTNYLELETLHKRWDEYNHSKCQDCKDWYRVGQLPESDKQVKRLYFHLIASFITLLHWPILAGLRKLYVEFNNKSQTENFVCLECIDIKNAQLIAEEENVANIWKPQKWYF